LAVHLLMEKGIHYGEVGKPYKGGKEEHPRKPKKERAAEKLKDWLPGHLSNQNAEVLNLLRCLVSV